MNKNILKKKTFWRTFQEVSNGRNKLICGRTSSSLRILYNKVYRNCWISFDLTVTISNKNKYLDNPNYLLKSQLLRLWLML